MGWAQDIGPLLMVDVDNLAWSQTRKERVRWFTPAFGADGASAGSMNPDR
jgi:hypothetical protein